jgi:pyruvate kinase
MRKTKIVCTLGPAVKNLETLKRLLIAGMNIARFNFSHGDHAYHKEMFDMVKEASRQTSIPVALMLDTKGPEIRIGRIKGGKTVELVAGNTLTLTTEETEGTEKRISISYKNLPREVSPGKHIYIADGLVDLEVQSVFGPEIHCIINHGAEIGSNKNVNVIGVRTALPVITEKDIQEFIFGIENNIDYIAASFIRKPSDIREIRSIVEICDARIGIIAKIEDQEGLDNIDEIIRVADGIMVARGDLGVQIPPEEIPLVQKRIIHKCNLANKPVITATQMLESMIQNPLPTRAEVTDIANSVLDGTDAVMLSGETANGKYPIEAVEIMHKTALKAENSREYREQARTDFITRTHLTMADTIARAAYITARDIDAQAILAPTLHGNTPKYISRYRPHQCIIAVTPHEEVVRKLLLFWGVYPVISEVVADSDTMIRNSITKAMEYKYIKLFDKVVILAGVPIDSPVMLNTIRISVIGTVLGKSQRGYGKSVSGRIVKVNDLAEAQTKVQGDAEEILLARYIDESFEPVLKKVAGYILEEFSSISWQAIYQMNPRLVALAGTADAMKNLHDKQLVTIDGEEKLIYEGIKPDAGEQGECGCGACS